MSTLAQLVTLPFEERLQILWGLWDSMAQEQEKLPLSDATKTELQRSLDEYRRTGDKGDTWDVVKQRILSQRLAAVKQ